MKRLLQISAACLFLLYSGCSTPYQQTGIRGGFDETQLDENIWRVAFRGNAYTSAERAADFTLLRSAELALLHGYSYFIIVDSQQYAQFSTLTTPTTSRTTASAYAVGNRAYGTATTTTTGGQTFLISKPRATNLIVCFNDRPEIDGMVYSAAFVVNSLSGKHGIRRD